MYKLVGIDGMQRGLYVLLAHSQCANHTKVSEKSEKIY